MQTPFFPVCFSYVKTYDIQPSLTKSVKVKSTKSNKSSHFKWNQIQKQVKKQYVSSKMQMLKQHALSQLFFVVFFYVFKWEYGHFCTITLQVVWTWTNEGQWPWPYPTEPGDYQCPFLHNKYILWRHLHNYVLAPDSNIIVCVKNISRLDT